MNKTTLLAIVALIIVAATAMGIYAMAQDAQARCNNGSISQSNRQHSSVKAAIIDHSDVGNQAGSNSVTVTSGCDSNCGGNG
jgi:hypothetical protein